MDKRDDDDDYGDGESILRGFLTHFFLHRFSAASNANGSREDKPALEAFRFIGVEMKIPSGLK